MTLLFKTEKMKEYFSLQFYNFGIPASYKRLDYKIYDHSAL